MLLFQRKGTNQVIEEIVRAIRILQKKRVSAILVIEKSDSVKRQISAQEIIEKVLLCQRGAVRLNFEEVGSVDCPLPFPEKVCRRDYTDQELGCLGLSQQSRAVVVSVSQSSEIALYYNNSIRRSISIQRLYPLLAFLLNQRKEKGSLTRELVVKRA